MKRVCGCATTALPNSGPSPGHKFTTPSGSPTSTSSSINFAAIVGASTEGFKITVFPVTIEAAVIPAIIANGKFHGGITVELSVRSEEHTSELQSHVNLV